jgi:hypothetical protein
VFSFIFRIVYVPTCFLQYDVSELDSIAQQLRHWNCAFLVACGEHAIPCGAKCYHIKLSKGRRVSKYLFTHAVAMDTKHNFHNSSFRA